MVHICRELKKFHFFGGVLRDLKFQNWPRANLEICEFLGVFLKFSHYNLLIKGIFSELPLKVYKIAKLPLGQIEIKIIPLLPKSGSL